MNEMTAPNQCRKKKNKTFYGFKQDNNECGIKKLWFIVCGG